MSAWRVGEHYGIHVYEGDRPVGTFSTSEDALRAVAALDEVDRLRGLLRDLVTDYGRVCDEPDCACSMAQARRLVEEAQQTN